MGLAGRSCGQTRTFAFGAQDLAQRTDMSISDVLVKSPVSPLSLAYACDRP